MMQQPLPDHHLWLVDSHVHLYGCFNPGELLTAAHTNLCGQARRLDREGRFEGLLLLTETQVDEGFERLRERVGQNADPEHPRWRGWQFSATSDARLLLAERGADRLWLVAGRQIVTAEKLEVLALITDTRFADGLSLPQTLEAIAAADAIPVLPWGAGKWWGVRGRLLSRLLADHRTGPLFLGDNGGRPDLWRHPRHFREARRHGIRILPGSDPLPLPWEARRVGTTGFSFTAPPARSVRPADELSRRLRDPAAPLAPFGGGLASTRFFLNQMALRLGGQHSTRRLAHP